jgi:phage/plasmid-associated DNA primase
MFNPAFSVKTVEVWEAYKAWAEANDTKPQKKQLLIQELESRGIHVIRNMVTLVHTDIQMKIKSISNEQC